MRRPGAAGVDRVIGARVVVRMIVGVRRAAHAVARGYVEPDAMPLREDHRCGPDLDIEAHYLSTGERKAAHVCVIGTIGQRKRRIELAMRCAQPALGDRDRLALLAVLEYIASVRRDVA